MPSSRFLALCLTVLAALAGPASSAAWAQPGPDYKPQIGQDGKDVVWVPTPQALVDKMLEIAKVGPQDFVVDLGSGDGRTVIGAARLGAAALGIEFNPRMVELSRRNAAKAGVSDKATFVNGDIFATDFSKATVVTMFLLPSLNVKLRPTILAMKPGTRVVSNNFDMGDWKADLTAHAGQDCAGYCKALLWIVPAKVDGTWQLGESRLTLKQEYQHFKGQLATGNVVAAITDGRLEADKVAFTAGGTRYIGRVKGAVMEGTAMSDGKESKWTATRR
jgi:SAM-dependent methyltransferase